jgi:methylated-DNA-[protein]-cysteine S-methyltransferase
MAEAGIYAREAASLDCHVQLGIAQGTVISVEFPSQPAPEAASEHALLDRIEAYLAGEPDDFADAPVAMTMPTDERAVLERLRTIPYGEEIPVEHLARLVPGRNPADEADIRAIREALAANPAPLLLPTHRVRDGPGGMPPDTEQHLRALEGLSAR